MYSRRQRANRQPVFLDRLSCELRREFDEIAPVYARVRPASEAVLQTLHTFLLSHKGMTVLEIGCGTGNYAIALTSTDASIWGVDFSLGMLAVARRRGKGRRVTWVCGHAEQLPFRDASFDFVFNVDLVHLVAQRRTMFIEALRVLRYGGVLCTVTKKHEHIRRRLLARYFPSITRVNTERFPHLWEITRVLRKVGFHRITWSTVTHEIPVTPAYLESVRWKTDSVLRRIPEREFREGLAAFERDAKSGTLLRQSARVFIWAHAPGQCGSTL